MRAFHTSWTVWLDGGSLAFSPVCWTSAYERLRAFESVCVMSLLQHMKFVRWLVMRDSPVRVGAYEVSRKMYKSCASGEMVGHSWHQMSGHVGSCRVKSGDIFFLRFLLWLRFCISFCVSGACFRFWQVLYNALPPLQRTTDSCRLAGDGAGGRVKSGQVAKSRVGAGSFPCYGLLRMTSSTNSRCIRWEVGSSQSCTGPVSPSESQLARVMAS